MQLAGRCAAAALLLAVGGFVVVANIREWDVPLAGSDRWSVALLGLVGVAMRALCPPRGVRAGAADDAVDVLTVGFVFVLGAGVLIGTNVVLATLLCVVAALWLSLAARHLPRSRAQSADDRERVTVDP